MSEHFTSYTPEAMRAFRQELTADQLRRRETLDSLRQQTATLLSDFRQQHAAASTQRRQQAAEEADGRKLFLSELHTGVHLLRNRFQLSQQEMKEDLRQMARECHQASAAFHTLPDPQPKHAMFQQPQAAKAEDKRPDTRQASNAAPSKRPSSSASKPGKKRNG